MCDFATFLQQKKTIRILASYFEFELHKTPVLYLKQTFKTCFIVSEVLFTFNFKPLHYTYKDS